MFDEEPRPSNSLHRVRVRVLGRLSEIINWLDGRFEYRELVQHPIPDNWTNLDDYVQRRLIAQLKQKPIEYADYYFDDEELAMLFKLRFG